MLAAHELSEELESIGGHVECCITVRCKPERKAELAIPMRKWKGEEGRREAVLKSSQAGG